MGLVNLVERIPAAGLPENARHTAFMKICLRPPKGFLGAC